jgi:hypothetical protein
MVVAKNRIIVKTDSGRELMAESLWLRLRVTILFGGCRNPVRLA